MAPKDILLVEDSGADACLFRMVAREVMPGVGISRVEGGEEALRRLQADGPAPDLVVLDLDLPDGDGFDVLSAIRSDVRLRDIPVVVWSASPEGSDVRRSYELGARLFISKGSGLAELYGCAAAVASLVEKCV